MQKYSLLVDLGNTRTKCRELSLNNGSLSWKPVTTMTNLLDYLSDSVKRFDEILISSVRSKEHDAQLGASLSAYATNVSFIKTPSLAFGLQNSYQEPSKMGVDRWLAMLGARLLTKGHFIVIDAGTAVTCDYVFNDLHQGGWIAPGFDLLRSSVTRSTARVTQATFDNYRLNFGQDTEECLHMGCIAQLHGMLLCALNQVTQPNNLPLQLVLSGGNADIFKPLQEQFEKQVDTVHCIENIVFFGLLQYSLTDFSLSNAQNLARSLLI